MESLLNHIETKIRCSESLKEAIRQLFTLEDIPKNTILLKEYQYARKLYFLKKGTVRTYYIDKDLDISSWFYRENQFFTAWSSFYKKSPSFEYIETLENCTIYTITYDKYQQLLLDFPAFERYGRLLAEEYLAFIDLYSKGYMFMSAKERYELLLGFFPDIELRVKLGYIASFLGISQATLSRIRSRK